jgi:hypothetical protein
MSSASIPTGPVRYGFEFEDLNQERALGAILSERRNPGDKDAAGCRAKVRAWRHQKKERMWNKFRVPIKDDSKTSSDDSARMNQIYLHELLDFAPYLKGEVQKLIESGVDGREAIRVGRLIREKLPENELKG